MKRGTVTKAMAAERQPGRETMSIFVALRIGNVLGFDPIHVSLVHARDKVATEMTRFGLSPIETTAYQDAIAQLNRTLKWNNPFKAVGSGQRHAFRSVRVAERLSIEEAARMLAAELGSSTTMNQDFEERLRLFEDGKLSIPLPEVSAWIAILSSGKLKPSDVHEIARKLSTFHNLGDTLDAQAVLGEGSSAARAARAKSGMHCPKAEGYAMEVKSSPTIYGSVYLDMIHARQPAPCERSPVRIVGARHHGFEIGVVMKGRVLFTLSESRFASEAPGDRPEFRIGQDGVVEHGVYEAGAIVAFRSGLYHRVEFLDKENCAVSINIRRNLLLARRIRHPLGD